MSSLEGHLQILENGEELQERQGASEKEQVPSAGTDDESSTVGTTAEKENHTTMQSLLQQVRKQMRSQGGARPPPQNTLLELVHKLKDGELKVKGGSGEDGGASGGTTDPSQEEKNQAQLEAAVKTLRVEFQERVRLLQEEMRDYTDKAVKDLEHRFQRLNFNTKEEEETRGLERRQKPPTVPPLTTRRGRLLTRTMTTTVPKTCPPVIVGPRARSETLKGCGGGQCLRRDSALSLTGNRPFQNQKTTTTIFVNRPQPHQQKDAVRRKSKQEVAQTGTSKMSADFRVCANKARK